MSRPSQDWLKTCIYNSNGNISHVFISKRSALIKQALSNLFIKSAS